MENKALENQIQEHDKVEGFNIFDAIMFGMRCSVEQHKQKETGAEDDGR